jgi:Tfp pilus tip-associated adhesin PilY1
MMVIDWVSKTAYKEPKDIQWTLQTRLEDLDFADNICMLSHRYQDMQHQATSLEEIAKQTCLISVSEFFTVPDGLYCRRLF